MRKVKGFTLIELLIVVVILGILATFVILTLSSATKKTKDVKVKDTIKTVQESLSIMAADTTDLAKAFTGLNVADAKVNLDSNNYRKIRDLEGKVLLSDIPLDAQNIPLKIHVTNAGDYEISGQSADSKPGDLKCWQYSTLKSANIGSGTADATFCLQ